MLSYRQFAAALKDISDCTEDNNLPTVVEEVAKDIYGEIPYTKIAEIIKEYHDTKVTDTLIESYITVASSNTFSVDPVVYELRKYNKLDRLIEGKISYTLKDNSVVAIDESTQDYLNKILSNQSDIVEYMTESKENFMHVLQKFGE